MRELASLGLARPALSKVGTLADVLAVALEALVAVAQHGEVAAHALSQADAHVRERAAVARAAPVVGEVDAQRRALRRWVVRERARVRTVGAAALQEGPADGDLAGVVLIGAGETTVA